MKHHLDTIESCSYFPGYQRNWMIYRSYLTMLMKIESLIVTIITNITITNNARGVIWIDYMIFQTISKGINAMSSHNGLMAARWWAINCTNDNLLSICLVVSGLICKMYHSVEYHMVFELIQLNKYDITSHYHQTTNISHILAGNKLVDHSDLHSQLNT